MLPYGFTHLQIKQTMEQLIPQGTNSFQLVLRIPGIKKPMIQSKHQEIIIPYVIGIQDMKKPILHHLASRWKTLIPSGFNAIRR